MPPKFGTSGLRGLVTELTPELVTAHVAAFLRTCPVGAGLFVGRDLRSSSPELAGVVIAAGRAAGLAVTDCGAVPTPALALAAMSAGAAAVMVTGSHIPADRNGLKFYTPDGEITKAHEVAILAGLTATSPTRAGPTPLQDSGAGPAWVARYVTAYGTQALRGMRIGVYSHSSVARDLMLETFRALGAGIADLGRSESFIPVDTEAVDAPTRAQLAAWAAEGFDAIVSTDGDGDRPLMTDAAGQVIPGDVLGQITAAALGVETVVTPVSSNTGAEASGRFTRVIRTKIGSPFVIAAMQAAGGKVAGYEANGGFLLGFAAEGPVGALPALMTRDSLLPLIAPLAKARGIGLAALVAAEPPRFTAADRLQDVPVEAASALVTTLVVDPRARAAFLASLGGVEAAEDRTDGLRLTLESGEIVHLRPSGNAPELRFYAEADSLPAASALLAAGLKLLREML
ncbi:phosphomannomutase [Cereibacter changlensis JA139]|uniref:Phosphomannomutase n=2 Tax=Cereibacter changlensis TaxID=402884 RepID=A0A2T4JZQ5_9RHOB|nr:phosphomannomutase [Cereibacter changlensis]PTE23346.1 phosphomannomutase [Cereibacter changlensis JA139]PZX48971.1 phosphomannomutase [Cereibacter changlensis]